MGRRENTFRLDFANVPKKPDIAKVHKFCATILGLKQGEVLRIHNSRTLGVSFVKVVSLELAQRICEKHDNKHEVSNGEKKFPLRITLEDGAVEVRLYDLSEDVSDQKIADFLERYGDAISIREQYCGADLDFPGIPTGVRIVKMVVQRNIESWITIDGETTQVSYFGQRQTCRHCRDYIHIGATCVQNKKLLVQKSYADAAKQMNATTLPPTTSKPIIPIVRQTEKNSDKLMQPPQQPLLLQNQPKTLPSLSISDVQSFTPLPSTSGSSDPSNNGSSTSTEGQIPDELPIQRSGKTDGNETDSSVDSSTSTRQLRNRPPGKKPRVDSSSTKQDGSNKMQ